MQEWFDTTLGDEFKIIMGQSPSSEFYNDKGQGFPFFQGKKEFGELYPRIEVWTTQATKKASKGDVLLSVRAPIGDVNIAPQECGIGRGLAAIKPNANTNSKFILYLLKAKENDLKKRGAGVTFSAITKPNLFSLPIRVPQRKDGRDKIVQAIETQFTRLDAAIKSLKAIKVKIVVYQEAILKEAFTTGFSRKVAFANLRLDDLKGEGKHVIKRGPFGSAIKKSFFVPKGYKVYEQQNAIYDNFELGTYYINEEKFKELQAFEVKAGDLIVSCSGTIGKVAVAPDNIEKGIINQALLKITLNPKVILTKYFIYLFQSRYLQHEVSKKTRGSAMMNISSVKDLKQIEFPVAKLDEQAKIVDEIESRFSVIDKLEATVDSSLKKSEKLRKSILKSAFEGKLVN